MTEIAPPHLLLVEAQFYKDISDELARGAISAIESAGATYERLAVPGAFEIPGAIALAIQAMEEVRDATQYDGFVALGCVIRGETSHYDYVCGESARGLMDLTLMHGLAIGNAILTVENQEQAWSRARIKDKNKGGTTAEACLAMIGLKAQMGLMQR
jgi:6,7-dimethyl-8-ribityllumazine synthase